MNSLTSSTVSTQRRSFGDRIVQQPASAHLYPQVSQDYDRANQSVNAVRPQTSAEVWRAQSRSYCPEDFEHPIPFPLSSFADGDLDLFAELGGFDPDLAASMGG
jgi:hypothetical protein